jgi:hypothetical protein
LSGCFTFSDFIFSVIRQTHQEIQIIIKKPLLEAGRRVAETIALIPKNDKVAKIFIDYGIFSPMEIVKAISKIQITLKYKARADERAEHTQ